jgi:DNA-binding response OmpR family regulator
MDGLALARALSRMEEPPPILFVSGYGKGGGELPGPFLPKPFPPEVLLAAVQKLLGASAQEARRAQ